jgi:predicted DNA binding CopG/RHH family protein
MNKKTKQITLRISEKDLLAIKAKAIKIGIPYQTLI